MIYKIIIIKIYKNIYKKCNKKIQDTVLVIKLKTTMTRSALFDYNDTYILN